MKSDFPMDAADLFAAIVEHSAGLGAHRGVHDLPVGQPPDVPCQRLLEKLLGVGPDDLELA